MKAIVSCLLLLALAAIDCKAECPLGGVWSDWTTTGACPTTCGSYSNTTRRRTCTKRCGDCPCVGPSTDVGPCGIALCPFPSQTCADGYKKSANDDTSEVFCGTSDVPKVTCPSTTTAPPTNISLHCPPNGVWSDWTTTGACPTTCGSYWNTTRRRTCTSRCGDCPCVGPSTDIGPCGIALCPFPSQTCADGYTKRANADTSTYFCGTDDVPQVVCSITTAAPTTTVPRPHCPQQGVWSEWEATEPCASSCGAFSVMVPRTRFCTKRCGDCPCVGASSDFGPCDITPCAAPGQECSSEYRKCLNRDTHKLFCGKVHVPPVECNATASTSVFLLPEGAYCVAP